MIEANEYFQVLPEERDKERENFVEKARKFYENVIRQKLSVEENGKFIAVEPDSGDYFIGESGREAIEKAQTVYPDKVFYLARFGYKTAYSLGGLRGNSREN